MDDDLYAIFAHDDEAPAGDPTSAAMVSLLQELVALSAAIDDELDDLVVDEALKALLADVSSVYTVLHDLEAKVRGA